MDKKINKKYTTIFAIIALIGIIVGRIIEEKYGENSSLLIVLGGCAVLLIIVIVVLIKSRDPFILSLLLMIVPIICGVIGLYLENIYLVSIGFIGLLIGVKVAEIMVKKKKK